MVEIYQAQRILPASEDGVFQALLTRPDAEPVLRDVISSVLMLPIREARVRNVALPVTGTEEKRELFDINCETDSGEQVEVEMQASALEGDTRGNRHANIKGRAIFNLADLHSSQLAKGVAYSGLMRTFQITFCGYTVFHGRDSFVNRFAFRNEDGETLLDAVGIVFVELTKLDDVLKKNPSDMTPLEMWAAFLSVAHKDEYQELVRGMVSEKEEIKMASEILSGISNDPIERARFFSRKHYEMDREHEQAVWRAEGKAAIVRNAFKMGMDVDTIMKLTDLSREEVDGLRG